MLYDCIKYINYYGLTIKVLYVTRLLGSARGIVFRDLMLVRSSGRSLRCLSIGLGDMRLGRVRHNGIVGDETPSSRDDRAASQSEGDGTASVVGVRVAAGADEHGESEHGQKGAKGQSDNGQDAPFVMVAISGTIGGVGGVAGSVVVVAAVTSVAVVFGVVRVIADKGAEQGGDDDGSEPKDQEDANVGAGVDSRLPFLRDLHD